MVHHEINQAINYSDEIIAMKNGEVLFQGKPNEVITNKSLKQLHDFNFKVIEYQ